MVADDWIVEDAVLRLAGMADAGAKDSGAEKQAAVYPHKEGLQPIGHRKGSWNSGSSWFFDLLEAVRNRSH